MKRGAIVRESAVPKVRDVMRRLERDGWVLNRTRGSHRVYTHPT